MKTFDEIFAGRPDKEEHGSSGYSNLKNLYDLCTELKPELIIESGHWKSNSAYLFHHFAPVISHDIQFDMALFEHILIERVQSDIENDINIAVPIDGGVNLFTFGTGGFVGSAEHTLFFFDCHVSHLQRLNWLIEIGAKHAVFDDNQIGSVAETMKNPPSPTLSMLQYDGNRIMKNLKEYRVMPFHKENKRDFNTRLTYIRL